MSDFSSLPEIPEIEPVQDSSGFDDLNQSLDGVLSEDVDLTDVSAVNDTLIGNFSDSGLTTNEEVTSYIQENIPSEHLNGLDSIEYVGNPSADKENILGMWISDGESVNIEVYPHDDPQTLYDTIAHEIGHNAEEKIPSDSWSDWENIYSSSIDMLAESNGENNHFVSDYAQTSSSEDFAETYSFYINDPEIVQAICPEKYDFLKNCVFNGIEF